MAFQPNIIRHEDNGEETAMTLVTREELERLRAGWELVKELADCRDEEYGRYDIDIKEAVRFVARARQLIDTAP